MRYLFILWILYFMEKGKGYMEEKIFVKQGEIERIKKEFDILTLVNEREKKNENYIFPKVYQYYEKDGYGWIEMEHIDGISLKNKQNIEKKEILLWMEQIIQGLIFLHTVRPGIIWCDCKPSNILVDQDNQIRLIDFDGALLLEDQIPKRCYGTWEYAAPEQKNGGKIDGRTDIYSFGVTILNKFSIPWYWKGVRSILRRCTEEEPSKRYQTASELLYALKKEIENPILKLIY